MTTLTPITFRVHAFDNEADARANRRALTHRIAAYRGDAEEHARAALDQGYCVMIYNENTGQLLQGPINPAAPYPAILDKADLAQGINRTDPLRLYPGDSAEVEEGEELTIRHSFQPRKTPGM
ncbi:hypothetical protein [Microvirga sesbaniae]|uniref:hypothetical protein n=1 Tax=Microvirga sesbaniae TaxID=681392 RepID=UPI0021C61B14|nr:hypothetical protein [Microvirga sp. HBU67692]